MSKLTPKERMAIPRHDMPEQDPKVRAHNFKEVNCGYTKEMAVEEANRCISCKNPGCVKGCPVNIKIPEFIAEIANENFEEAAKILKQDSALPAVCGRVCPQEKQCENNCILAKNGKSVAIGNLERFAADYEREHFGVRPPVVKPKTGKKVAIVGGGPAGLSCAGDLIASGHDVTLFEALHEVGGVLIYGIPEFRLPKDIVKAEVDALVKAGVKIETNSVIGMSDTIDELLAEYDAVFVAVGAGLPYFMNIPGEQLNGVYSSNEYLTRVNLMKAYKFPENDTPIFDIKGKTVAVFGGGNTAMDAVRTSLRLGAERAMILYRRSEAEMPARKEEVNHAKEEGVEFRTLMAPLEFKGDEKGYINSMVLQQCELGEPDASGRRRPVPIEGAITEEKVDVAVVAIGNGSNPIIARTTPDLELNKRGNIVVDEETMKTNKKGVFAGGDIVTGGATVILAMGAGRKAAAAINEYLANPDKW